MKKGKPPKKYTEEEQLQRRKEDHAAIVGKRNAKKRAEFSYIYGGGRRAGKSYLRNMLLQAQAAETDESKAKVKKGLLNFALQMNFTAIEIRAITHYLKTGELEDSSSEYFLPKERDTIKIEKTQCASTCFSATCTKCNTTKILGIELKTMTLICNKCYTVFNLEN